MAEELPSYHLHDDQQSSEGDRSLCDDLPPFLSLEPPMTDSDYLFSLDTSEGLAELFDFI